MSNPGVEITQLPARTDTTENRISKVQLKFLHGSRYFLLEHSLPTGHQRLIATEGIKR